jgi:hypothetical protein
VQNDPGAYRRPAPPSERNQSARADFSNRNQARCSGLSSIAAVRNVLVWSIGLVVLAFLVVYLLYFRT